MLRVFGIMHEMGALTAEVEAPFSRNIQSINHSFVRVFELNVPITTGAIFSYVPGLSHNRLTFRCITLAIVSAEKILPSAKIKIGYALLVKHVKASLCFPWKLEPGASPVFQHKLTLMPTFSLPRRSENVWFVTAGWQGEPVRLWSKVQALTRLTSAGAESETVEVKWRLLGPPHLLGVGAAVSQY